MHCLVATIEQKVPVRDATKVKQGGDVDTKKIL